MPPPVTSRDVPLLILSTASSSERRITPSWSIAQLKSKLEPVTGIPPSAQKLTLRLPERQETSAVEADDEETVQIGQWPLVPYAELKVRQRRRNQASVTLHLECSASEGSVLLQAWSSPDIIMQFWETYVPWLFVVLRLCNMRDDIFITL